VAYAFLAYRSIQPWRMAGYEPALSIFLDAIIMCC